MERHITSSSRWRAGPMGRHLLPVALLVTLPIVANVLMLTGILHGNPLFFVAQLTSSMGHRVLPASPGWLDPTIGLITQPLGMLSAKDWLHGIVPWWNPYSGVGMPLAAEMQTMSFFLPFVLLLKFWQGWLVLKLVLQILCGLCLYALLIELGMTRLAALVGGTLYALNATFFLVPHAMGPLPFAPLLLLGIERARRAALADAPLGWGLIPLALAYSLYGGYPEVAYIDGTLAAVWTVWRFIGLPARRWRFAGKIALGGGIGMAMALPILVPFAQYVGLSYLGTHASAYGWLWLWPAGAPAQLFPFIYGPIGAAIPPSLAPLPALIVSSYWVQTAGWFGPVAAFLAMAALLRPARLRSLDLLLAGFVFVWEARIWGLPPAIWLINQVPLMAHTDAMRFCGPALELAVFIMAAIAVDGWQRGGALPGRRAAASIAAAIAIAAVPIGFALPTLIAWFRAAPARLGFSLGLSIAELILAAGAVLLLATRPTRQRALLIGLLVATDAMGASLVTSLGAPDHAAIARGGVRYLQRHLGTARMYSMRPFGPDYPAAFRLAAIDENALPVQATWNDYIHRHLDPYADVVFFDGWQPRHLNCVLLPHAAAALQNLGFVRPRRTITPPDQAAELRRHLAAYEAIGVKFVLAPPGENPFAAAQSLPLDGQSRVAFSLGPNAGLSGVVPPGILRLDRISRIDVLVGTYNGASTGVLTAKLCAGASCAVGTAKLTHASDNRFLDLELDHPLALPAGATLRYRLRHGAGHPVAIWLGALDPLAPAALAGPTMPAAHAPLIHFVSMPRTPAPALVFSDAAMRIYRLPAARPLIAAPACRMTNVAWNHATADCAAAARLLWLEAAYPGWHALIDNHPVSLATTGTMFQSLALPAGVSNVRFFYRPPFIRMSVGAAVAAFCLWMALQGLGYGLGQGLGLGLGAAGRRRGQRNRDPGDAGGSVEQE